MLLKPTHLPGTLYPLYAYVLSTVHNSQKAKGPKCSSMDGSINTMEYYSAIKKNTFESVLMRWMKVEPIIQSEVSYKEKHQYSILTRIYGI